MYKTTRGEDKIDPSPNKITKGSNKQTFLSKKQQPYTSETSFRTKRIGIRGLSGQHEDACFAYFSDSFVVYSLVIP